MKVYQLIDALKSIPYNPYLMKVISVQTHQDCLEVTLRHTDGTIVKLDYAWDGKGWVNVHE